jgi:hypothetical protein
MLYCMLYCVVQGWDEGSRDEYVFNRRLFLRKRTEKGDPDNVIRYIYAINDICYVYTIYITIHVIDHQGYETTLQDCSSSSSVCSAVS